MTPRLPQTVRIATRAGEGDGRSGRGTTLAAIRPTESEAPDWGRSSLPEPGGHGVARPWQSAMVRRRSGRPAADLTQGAPLHYLVIMARSRVRPTHGCGRSQQPEWPAGSEAIRPSPVITTRG